jgi:hypothetical protein
MDFYLRCDVKGFVGLLSEYKNLAENLNDKARLGRFYGWLGCALWYSQRLEEAYGILRKAIKIGEELNDLLITGYAKGYRRRRWITLKRPWKWQGQSDPTISCMPSPATLSVAYNRSSSGNGLSVFRSDGNW